MTWVIKYGTKFVIMTCLKSVAYVIFITIPRHSESFKVKITITEKSVM